MSDQLPNRLLERWATALRCSSKGSKGETYLLAFLQNLTEETRREAALNTRHEPLVRETWAHLKSLEGEAKDRFTLQLADLPTKHPSQFENRATGGTWVGED